MSARRAVRLSLRRPSIPWPQATRTIVANAGSLVATTGVTSALGAAFWLLAARHYPKPAIGLASATISAMTVLGSVATLGFGTMLIGEVAKRRSGARPLVTAALLFTSALAVVLGLVFAFVASRVSSDFEPLGASAFAIVVFAAGVALSSSGEVVDGVTIGLLRGHLQLWRNTGFAAAKLLLLIIVVAAGTTRSHLVLLTVWTAGIALSLAGLGAFVVMRTGALATYLPRVGLLRGQRRVALSHQAFNLAFKIPTLVLPVIVVTVVSPAANASFYVALMIAGFLYVVPAALSTVLFAVAHDDREALATKIRLTLALSVSLGAVAAAGIAALAHPVLELFGRGYGVAAGAERILALGVLPVIVKTHFLAVTRIQGRFGSGVPLVWLGTLTELALAIVGGLVDGVEGTAAGWTLALALEAAAMAPRVLGAARPRLSQPPPAT